MTEDRVRRALLVQAIEEKAGEVITPTVAKEARQRAGNPADDKEEWINRRSAAVLERIDPYYSTILQLDPAPTTLLSGLIAAAAIFGLAANYLGDHGRVHVLFNPVFALVVWNLAVYLVVLVSAIAGRPRRAPRGRVGESSRSVHSGNQSISSAPRLSASEYRVHGIRGSIVRAILLRGFRWGQEALSRLHSMTAPVKSFGSVAARFVWLWQQTSERLLFARLKRAVHGAALALTVGAVAGMYIRGVGFQYNAFWSSTFIRDPDRVGAILSVVFAPVSFVLRQRFPSEIEVSAILTPDGAIAAAWIHAYALLAFLLIVIPRVGLIVAGSIQIRSMRRNLHVDLGDPHWVRTLRGDAELDLGVAASGVLREFALDRHATTVLVSLQNALVERDIANRSRPSSERDTKARWLEQWRDTLSGAQATLPLGEAPTIVPLDAPAFLDAVEKLKTTAPPMAPDLILLEVAAFARFVAFRPLTRVWPLTLS